MTKPLTILVVEDDEATRSVYKELLEDRGHTVRLAPDGLAGLEQMDLDVDIVVSDLRMPRMSGEEMLRAIRATEAFRYVPVLVVSGAPAELPLDLRGAWTSTLRKPFRLDLLGRYVESFARQPARN